MTRQYTDELKQFEISIEIMLCPIQPQQLSRSIDVRTSPCVIHERWRSWWSLLRDPLLVVKRHFVTFSAHRTL